MGLGLDCASELDEAPCDWYQVPLVAALPDHLREGEAGGCVCAPLALAQAHYVAAGQFAAPCSVSQVFVVKFVVAKSESELAHMTVVAEQRVVVVEQAVDRSFP